MARNGMRYILVRILDLENMIEKVAFNIEAHDTTSELLRLYSDLQDLAALDSNLQRKFQIMLVLSELMSRSDQLSERLVHYTKLISKITQLEVKVRYFLNPELSTNNPLTDHIPTNCTQISYQYEDHLDTG